MSFLKKIPKWCWYVFPMAILLIFFFALRGGGRGALRWLSPPRPPASRPPAITSEEAEDQREEVKEEKEDEREKIREEAQSMRERLNR